MKQHSMDVAAVVPAAGSGTRFTGSPSKLFAPLHGRPLLAHTLAALQVSPDIRWIIVVVRAGEQARMRTFLKQHAITKAVLPCVGGASRAASVARGCAVVPRAARWVLIHDGARPCVTPDVIARAVRAARREGAVACGLPATVTVKAVDERQGVRLTLDRESLWLVQTPQVFRREWITQALTRAGSQLEQFPDDAAILEAAGFPVRMVHGDPRNIKVTTKDDLILAETILSHRVQHTAQSIKHKAQSR
ncbi:MAG: 2-C-methyl-D-erythritol 4-phosphate cytidylyltransferase [Candidatus Omnitrophica bacterium]|nr:2-C-methyl-D-erythritol 4-phosphate cytidylyltransferase [Candidatus Omnitrophota bacterium]